MDCCRSCASGCATQTPVEHESLALLIIGLHVGDWQASVPHESLSVLLRPHLLRLLQRPAGNRQPVVLLHRYLHSRRAMLALQFKGCSLRFVRLFDPCTRGFLHGVITGQAAAAPTRISGCATGSCPKPRLSRRSEMSTSRCVLHPQVWRDCYCCAKSPFNVVL